MDSTFRSYDWTGPADAVASPRACRAINCDSDAVEMDVFCGRCREEIDAVRETARRRFVIFGAWGRRPLADSGR